MGEIVDKKKRGRPPAYSQTLRLLQLLELFHLRRLNGLTIKEMMDRFDVTRRTIYRDLLALQEIHIPITEEKHGTQKIWKLMDGFCYEIFREILSQ